MSGVQSHPLLTGRHLYGWPHCVSTVLWVVKHKNVTQRTSSNHAVRKGDSRRGFVVDF